MSKPETIRVELSAADRRLLQRVVDALERAHPKSAAYRNHPAGTRFMEPARGVESGVETNPTLFQRLTGQTPAYEPDGDPDISGVQRTK